MNPRIKLIHHISRLEGQLSAVKAELAKENPNCAKASTTLLSASRSFASLRQEFVQCFLTTYFIGESQSKSGRALLGNLLTLIRG